MEKYSSVFEIIGSLFENLEQSSQERSFIELAWPPGVTGEVITKPNLAFIGHVHDDHLGRNDERSVSVEKPFIAYNGLLEKVEHFEE